MTASRSRRSNAPWTLGSTGWTPRPVYGLGRSEEVVGRALKPLGASRPFVFTKCSLVWQDDRREVRHNLEAASIRREVEASLRRLGVETIDLMQIHWPRFMGGARLAGQHRGGLDRARGAEEVGQAPAHRRLEFPRRRPGAGVGHRAGRDPATALLDAQPGHRGRDVALLRGARHRCRRLLADGGGPPQRPDDPRAGRGHARRRLANEESGVQGAEAVGEPAARRESCARLGRGTIVRLARWRWRGRCDTRRSRPPSSASGDRTR